MEISLNTSDFVVMVIFVLISFGIGIFYGICKKQQTTEAYLLGDRQMHLLPVALSLVVTYQSASSVLGVPAEIYIYHTMGQYLALGIILAVIVQGVFIVPFVHPLKLTSAYEIECANLRHVLCQYTPYPGYLFVNWYPVRLQRTLDSCQGTRRTCLFYGANCGTNYGTCMTHVYNEYLGRRYQSRAVQLMGTSLGMLQTLLYMATVLYAPALALEAVAKIPLWLSVVLIGIVGTLYTSMGGIKSVVWTDAFQFIVLYGGLMGILAIGIKKVGGITGLFHEANEGHRVRFNIIDPNPTVRHSVWTCVIGGFFMWLPNCCNQSAVQRMSSVRTVKESRIIDPNLTVRHSVWTCVIGGFFMWLQNCCNQSAVQRMSSVTTVNESTMSVFLNVPLILLFETTLALVGLMLFAYFRLTKCDPILADHVSNANQILPYFVMMILQDVPGLAGIFVAALFSGSLSSLSSGINAMAANTIQDVLVDVLANTSQVTKTLIAKCIVLVYGTVAVTLAYFAKYLTGPVTQIALTCMGATGSPVAGIMFLGAMFPQANYIGALSGGCVGILLNIWMAVGSFLYGNQTQRSPLNPTSGCAPLNLTTSVNTSTTMDTFQMTTMITRETRKNGHLVIYDISYLYFGLIGFVSTVIVGLAVSLLTRTKTKPTQSEYIIPCLRSYWKVGYSAVHKTDSSSEEIEMDSVNTRSERIKGI